MITRQPENQTVVAGSSVTLGVTTTGAGPLVYQWRFQGQNLPGATNAALSLRNVRIGDAGEYQAVVLSAGNSAASAPATLTVLSPATIITQPAGRNINPGGATTLAVSAKGSGPLTYQWRFNSADIPGATGASLRE